MLDEKMMPPCMSAILADLAAGKNVPHAGRRSFATFSLLAGLSPEDVAKAFVRTPNYSKEKTGSQIASLAGHAPSNCEKMVADGLCPKHSLPPLCDSISNPISFMRARRGDAPTMPNKPVEPQRFVLKLVRCKDCGWQSKPLPETVVGAVADLHYWSFGPNEGEAHLVMEYLEP